MSKSIEDLREHLFATLDALRDKDNPMDVDRARAVSEVAKQVIDSAKVEVDYLKATGAAESRFLAAPTAGQEALPNGIAGIVRHQLRG